MPETDGTNSGQQVDIEALLRQALGGPGFDGRFGVGRATGGRDNTLSSSSDFSVPTAGTTPTPRPAAPMTPEPQPANVSIPFDASKVPSNLIPATTPSQVPKPPTGSNNPNLTDLLRQQAMFGKPLDRNAEDHPTLGQRIAGDLPRPQPAPVQAQPDTPSQPAFQFDPSKLPDALRPPTPTPNQVPQPQTGARNPNLTALAKQQADYGKPLDRSDPKYKMGWGQRILGTIANFASGFGGNGGNPIYVGPGATNWKFGRDEATREANLANVNTQIGTQEKLDSQNEKMYRDAIRQAYEGEVGEARKGTATAQEENAATKAPLAQSQRDLNEARANKADTPQEPRTEAEIAVAYQNALLKKDPKAAVYKGALAELAKQKAAGKDNSAADVQKAIQVAEFRDREHDKVEQAKQTERAKRHEEFSRTPAGKIDFDGKKTAAFDAQLTQELEAKYAARHQSVDTDADKLLGLTKAGSNLKTGNAPAQSKFKVGDAVTYKGKPHHVKAIRPNGKLELGE